MTREQKIIEKQKEYIAYLKRAIHSESIIDNITSGVRDKFDAELSALESSPPTETYEKVYIKTESDLPEHYDFYCCSLNDDITPCLVEYQYQNRRLNNKWWLNNINWYLRPIKH